MYKSAKAKDFKIPPRILDTFQNLRIRPIDPKEETRAHAREKHNKNAGTKRKQETRRERSKKKMKKELERELTAAQVLTMPLLSSQKRFEESSLCFCRL